MADSRLKEAELLAAALFFAHDLFRPPTPEQWLHLTSDRTDHLWTALAGVSGLPPEMGLPEDESTYEAEYFVVFGDGKMTPPVPLRESDYHREESRTSVLRENVAYYRAFDLHLREQGVEAADHLLRQLEFVGFLYRLESAVLRNRDEAKAAEADEKLRKLAQARAEYVSRHILSWLPQAARTAESVQVIWAWSFLKLAEELSTAAGRPASLS